MQDVNKLSLLPICCIFGDSGEYRYVRGKVQRNRERITVRGSNDNHHRDLKNLFKGAAISAGLSISAVSPVVDGRVLEMLGSRVSISQ